LEESKNSSPFMEGWQPKADGVVNQSSSAQSELSELQKALANITLVPNPTTGELRITSYELRIDEIEIFDIYGKKVWSKFPSVIPNVVRNLEHYGQQTDGAIINITVLPAGIYFVKIKTEVGEVIKKVVKN
jgi:hypothetical protein